MNIGIVGNGVVGSATANAFKMHSVTRWDKDRSRCTHTLSAVLNSDIIFVCLPTPANLDGRCDTSILDTFFEGILRVACNRKYLVLRSTVPVGYTQMAARKFDLPNLVHSPEFLTARTADEDAANPTRNIIGYVYDTEHPISRLYRERWPDVTMYKMTSNESEAVKLFQNSFSAIKVAAFNEFYQFAMKHGMAWSYILDALLAGGWINPMHTKVPGPDGKTGFGGACLPKDLANLRMCMVDAELNPWMCEAALTRNEIIDRSE